MSLEFNRRSFLKYSAAAAVAVAGSSLLVGCGEDEYQKTGKIGSTLKLMGAFKLESAKLDSAPTATAADKTLTCNFSLKCTSKYGLNIVPANFQVEVTSKATKKVTTYHAYNTDGTGGVSLSNSNNYLKTNENGGITDDRYITAPEEMAEGTGRTVRMSVHRRDQYSGY